MTGVRANGIGLGTEQRALADAVSGFLARHVPRDEVRAGLAAFAEGASPQAWALMGEQGLLTDHLPDACGGTGAGWIELAVTVEEAARALLPGPFLPTVLTTAILADAGALSAWPRTDGSPSAATGACALGPGRLEATAVPDGWLVRGRSDPILCAAGTQLLLLAAAVAGGGDVWFLVRPEAEPSVSIVPAEGVDLTRSIGQVDIDGLVVTDLPGVATGRVRDLAAVLFAAEAVGLARWCLDTTVEYARVREQFGRPVGSFQAVKHRLARLYVRVGLAAATAWDAARAVADGPEQLAVASSAAATRCPSEAREVALDCVTLLGGIGYTWEHDIHLYWRRAIALRQLLGSADEWAAETAARHGLGPNADGGQEVGRHPEAGRVVVRSFDVRLEDEDAGFRAVAAAVIARAARLADPARRLFLAEQGYVAPEYPRPYGIDADPVQQLVIAQEFARAGVPLPDLRIGAFTLPTVLAHGTQGQRERFIPPALRGETVWCQLFSEPGAGSDLASVATRAVRVAGGWRLRGQKVWTSRAHEADWAVCLARTDPDTPRHGGLSCFLVDMHADGVEIRPLRQANGSSAFNEVFLSDVLVPDDCLVGEPGQGWAAARTTLANERVSIAGKVADGWAPLAALAGRSARGEVTTVALGHLAAANHGLSALMLRSVLMRLSGRRFGAESSVLKVAAAEHHRDLATAALGLLGPAGATVPTGGAGVSAYLGVPARLIGGGTMEIQLNVIAERVLGLPRDPRGAV